MSGSCQRPPLPMYLHAACCMPDPLHLPPVLATSSGSLTTPPLPPHLHAACCMPDPLRLPLSTALDPSPACARPPRPRRAQLPVPPPLHAPPLAPAADPPLRVRHLTLRPPPSASQPRAHAPPAQACVLARASLRECAPDARMQWHECTLCAESIPFCMPACPLKRAAWSWGAVHMHGSAEH